EGRTIQQVKMGEACSSSRRGGFMGKNENIAAQGKFGEAVVSGKLEGLRDVVDAKALDHDPGEGQGLGPDGFIHYFGELRKAFPDLNIVAEKLVADDGHGGIA